MSLQYRYLRRLYKRYCEQGDRGLVHQGRGRPSNRARPPEFKATVLVRYLCIEEERTLTLDWVVRFQNQFYQLQPLRKQ